MRYKEIADRLEGEILSSKSPGDRLLSLRELARKEHISLITARNVYLYLRQRGLISSKQGSGTFVAKTTKDALIDMASIKPPEELLLWVGAYMVKAMGGISAYDPPQGFDLLRDQAKKWLEPLGINYRPLITAGSQQALFLAGMAILNKGDIVAIEDPGYSGATRIFEALGARIKKVPYIDSSRALDILQDPEIRIFYTMPQGH
ncbi:MAG: aminotransferase class I/II-fold pyridoxal phosphate-dependent enzyme, partial [Deltaproteobacteria bacterium]|nr:aminotransferase class I/II-fold pyridoxal phosphate-dependent enzyme [Deltaproteobacteria bacterium]